MSIFDFFKAKQYKNELLHYRELYTAIGGDRFDDVTRAVEEKSAIVANLDMHAAYLSSELQRMEGLRVQTAADLDKLNRQADSQTKRISRGKEIYRAMSYALQRPENPTQLVNWGLLNELNIYYPAVVMNLHHMDVRSLRQAYRENDKQISKVVDAYQGRYTTKANRAIYQLMVIALRSELQNILYNLKYDKLDAAIDQIYAVTAKYQQIAAEGNQSIAPTITRFIGEMEYLFINAAKIEYNYYVKKEQAKQEQLAIRHRMREEAEERRALEREQKRIEAEEAKFHIEIERTRELLGQAATEEEKSKLTLHIHGLEAQLADVIIKKEEIVKLQSGKAGTVYIISNKGSFGDDIFKVGMTRRLDPNDRINELASAAVPFRFDIHSFIFSNDAVELEAALHRRLNDRRVNKVNMRKEYFYSSIDELEELVNELDPTAEFNRLMVAEEYTQSLSTDENYTSEDDSLSTLGDLDDENDADDYVI